MEVGVFLSFCRRTGRYIGFSCVPWLVGMWLTVLALSVPAQAMEGAVRDSVLTDSATAPSGGTHFRVSGFRVLPNDVSAFISPVRDLNGDACALVKVVGPADCAFSSPLGIVKRLDKVGEIWLYLPRGTRMLTIKHPQWGVLRDYRLAKPLEGHVTYELKIERPRPAVVHMRDTVVFTQTITDTIVVDRRKLRPAWRMHGLLTASLHERGPSWGVMFTMLRRHGFFVHGQSDLQRVGQGLPACDRDGFLPGSTVKPYYTGDTRRASYAFTAGATHRLLSWLGLFYGMGYGRSSVAWRLADSEGGGYVLNEGLSHEGVAAEAGVLLSYKRLSLSASALTVRGELWQAVVGIGIRLWKAKE